MMKNKLICFYILGIFMLFHSAKGIQNGMPFSSNKFEYLNKGSMLRFIDAKELLEAKDHHKMSSIVSCMSILVTPTSSFTGKWF